jgi:hypothetical protein
MVDRCLAGLFRFTRVLSSYGIIPFYLCPLFGERTRAQNKALMHTCSLNSDRSEQLKDASTVLRKVL